MSMESISGNLSAAANTGYEIAKGALSDEKLGEKISAGTLAGYNAAQGIFGGESIADKIKTGAAIPLYTKNSIFGKLMSDGIKAKQESVEKALNQEGITKKGNILFIKKGDILAKLFNLKKHDKPIENTEPKTLKEIYENGKPGMILAKYEPPVCDEKIETPDISDSPFTDGGIVEKPHNTLEDKTVFGAPIACDL